MEYFNSSVLFHFINKRKNFISNPKTSDPSLELKLLKNKTSVKESITSKIPTMKNNTFFRFIQYSYNHISLIMIPKNFL